MTKFKLRRIRQCLKCPWKKSVDPHTIPNGYSLERHKALISTIETRDSISSAFGEPTHIMACHESALGKEDPCLGWLINQLGPGNNISLRIRFINCENLHQVTLTGDQHKRFEDTIPKYKEGLK